MARLTDDEYNLIHGGDFKVYRGNYGLDRQLANHLLALGYLLRGVPQQDADGTWYRPYTVTPMGMEAVAEIDAAMQRARKGRG